MLKTRQSHMVISGQTLSPINANWEASASNECCSYVNRDHSHFLVPHLKQCSPVHQESSTCFCFKNSIHLSSLNISINQDCPSPLSVCTMCVAAKERACDRVYVCVCCIQLCLKPFWCVHYLLVVCYNVYLIVQHVCSIMFVLFKALSHMAGTIEISILTGFTDKIWWVIKMKSSFHIFVLNTYVKHFLPDHLRTSHLAIKQSLLVWLEFVQTYKRFLHPETTLCSWQDIKIQLLAI